MVKGYRLLAISLMTLGILRPVVGLWPRSPELAAPCQSDAESRLACGRKMPFASTGPADWELIPRVADKRAFNIEKERAAVLAEAARLPAQDRSQALEIARGVGPKEARRLGQFLSF